MKHHAELKPEWRSTRATCARVHSPYGVIDSSKIAAIAANFSRQGADENCGLGCVCRSASRRMFGHCFGALPAPGGNSTSASATPPIGLRFPSKSCSASTPKDFSGPSVNAELRHLGAGPTRKATPAVTRTGSGNSTNGDTTMYQKQSNPQRLPRQRCRSSPRHRPQLYHLLPCYKILLQGREQQPIHLAYRVAPLHCLREALGVRQDAEQRRTCAGGR